MAENDYFNFLHSYVCMNKIAGGGNLLNAIIRSFATFQSKPFNQTKEIQHLKRK